MFGQVVYSIHESVPTIVTCIEDFTQIEVQGEFIAKTLIGLSEGRWKIWVGRGPGGAPIVRSEKLAA